MNSKSQQIEPLADLKPLAEAAAAVFNTAIQESGKLPEIICAETRDTKRCIEHEPKTLSAWCQPADSVRDESPLLRAAIILKCTDNSAPLQWLCGQVGGVFVPDASKYGRLSLLKSLPFEIRQFPEMAEWLVQSERMAALKGNIYKLTMSGEAFPKDKFAELVISWLAAKGWVEGYLEWTGAEGANLSRPAKATPAARIVEARHVVKYAFGNYPKGEPHTKTIAACLNLSDSSVQKWQQLPHQGKSGSANPFDHIAVLSHATGSLKMIEWLCSQMEGNLRSDKTSKTDGNMSWPRVYWELTKLEYFVSCALQEDGDVSPEEAEQIRKQWNDVRSWMTALICAKVQLNP